MWNLVLACPGCNRGRGGKRALAPAADAVARLHRRNGYLIQSHHPLRETLMAQTGRTGAERRDLLRRFGLLAHERLVHEWRAPEPRGPLP